MNMQNDSDLMRRAVVRKAKSIRSVVSFTTTVLAAALTAPATGTRRNFGPHGAAS